MKKISNALVQEQDVLIEIRRAAKRIVFAIAKNKDFFVHVA